MSARRLYELHVHGCADLRETVELQRPIASLLCPEAFHASPCEVPWSFSIADPAVLVLGIYAEPEQAKRIHAGVVELLDRDRSVRLHDGDPELFADLVEQYEIERGLAG